jgi:hypothetical protein
MFIQKPCNDLIGARSILVKVEIVARIRMKVRHERFGVLIVRRSRLHENSFTLAVADDVVVLARNRLQSRQYCNDNLEIEGW